MPPRRRKTTPTRSIDYLSLDTITGAEVNPKLHDDAGIRASVDRFGYAEPILLDERTGRLVAGHGRLDALKASRDAGDSPPDGVLVDPSTGEWTVPVVRGWSSRSDEEARAYLVASNRLTERGGWDDRALADLLTGLSPDLLETTGYTGADLDELVAKITTNDKRKAREDRDPDPQPTVPTRPTTRPGDVWLLGRHRLACGDATDPAVITTALAGAPIDLVFTSPPYNVGVDYAEHDDKPADWPEYSRFLRAIVESFLPHLPPGRAVAWNIGTSAKTYHARQHVLLEQLGLTYVRTCVWKKAGVPVPSWNLRTAHRPKARKFHPNYRHELVLVFGRGELADVDPTDPDPARALAVYPNRRPFAPTPDHELVVVFANAPKLKQGRAVSFTDLLEHDVFSLSQHLASAGLPDDPNAGRTGAQSGLKTRARKVHPAPFPVELPQAFAVHLADVGAVVFDPFAGSGSTLLAADRTGRLGVGVELSPAYVDVACARYQRLTDDRPVLERTGQPHDFTALADTADDQPDPDPS